MRQSASFSKLVWPFSDVQRRQYSDLVGGEQGERGLLCARGRQGVLVMKMGHQGGGYFTSRKELELVL